MTLTEMIYKNDLELHPCFYEGGKLQTKAGDEPPDGKWLLWLDKYGNFEKARMKLDAYDHFYPQTTFIESEEDIVAWAYFDK